MKKVKFEKKESPAKTVFSMYFAWAPERRRAEIEIVSFMVEDIFSGRKLERIDCR